VDKLEYDIALVAVVHSHPIIREKDWCPDIGEHTGGEMSEECHYAKYDVDNKKYCCKINKDYIGGNHDFSMDDYRELYRLLKTSAIGYLVAKKENGEWTLMKFEWPDDKFWGIGLRVWEPIPIPGQWENVTESSADKLLNKVLVKLKDCDFGYKSAPFWKKFTYNCAYRTLTKVIKDIIIEKELLKEIPIILNDDNLSRDSWKTNIESYMVTKGWTQVLQSLECDNISENSRKAIQVELGRGWRCDKYCTLTRALRCGWR
jgi:hypothetical protein